MPMTPDASNATPTEEINLECINGPFECSGPVEYRMNLSGTGMPTVRCDKHWEDRLNLEDELRSRYPVHAPSDWSPLDAGESWNED